MRIEFVGHATVVVDLDGVRLLTDPVLRNRVAHLRRVVPVDAKKLRGVDAVLISHAHYDHLDVPSLERLGKKLPLVMPRGLGGLLRKRRFESVHEIELGESISVGPLEVRAVQAEHEANRGPFLASAASLGYVVSGSRTVYFAGDTDLFDGMSRARPGGRRARSDLGLGHQGGNGPPRPGPGAPRRSRASGRRSSSRSTGARTTPCSSVSGTLPTSSRRRRGSSSEQ